MKTAKEWHEQNWKKFDVTDYTCGSARPVQDDAAMLEAYAAYCNKELVEALKLERTKVAWYESHSTSRLYDEVAADLLRKQNGGGR